MKEATFTSKPQSGQVKGDKILGQLVEDVQVIEKPVGHQGVEVRVNKGEAKNALARAVFFNRLGLCGAHVDRVAEDVGVLGAAE